MFRSSLSLFRIYAEKEGYKKMKRRLQVGDVFDPGILPNVFFVVTHVPHDLCVVGEPNHQIRVVPAIYSLFFCDENDIIGFTQARHVIGLLTYLDVPILSKDLGTPIDLLKLDSQLLKALLMNLQDRLTGGFERKQFFTRTTSDGLMRSTRISDGKQTAWYITREAIPNEDVLKRQLFRDVMADFVQEKIHID